MSRVVLFQHRGFACAVPASQVRRIGKHAEEAPLVLWGDASAAPANHAAALVVQTRQGPRVVPCADAQFLSMDGATLLPLPDFLRAALGMEHVVGVAELDGHFVWLVDLARWEERHDEH